MTTTATAARTVTVLHYPAESGRREAWGYACTCGARGNFVYAEDGGEALAAKRGKTHRCPKPKAAAVVVEAAPVAEVVKAPAAEVVEPAAEVEAPAAPAYRVITVEVAGRTAYRVLDPEGGKVQTYTDRDLAEDTAEVLNEHLTA